MTTKTHRERAREAANYLMLAVSHSPSDEDVATIIHDRTYPTELVEAARFLLARCTLYGPADQAREKFRAALELYKDPAP